MATLDIFRLVFIDILKISTSILYKYPTIQDQLFYLLFLPHVILFLFLFGFGMFIVPEGRADSPPRNRGLRYLVTAAGYIFIVYEGWYGQILIPLFQVWFWIMLAGSLFIFLIARIFHPFQAQALGAAVAKHGGRSIGKQVARGKELEALQKDLDETQKLLVRAKREYNRASNDFEKARAQANISALEHKERDLRRAITKY